MLTLARLNSIQPRVTDKYAFVYFFSSDLNLRFVYSYTRVNDQKNFLKLTSIFFCLHLPVILSHFKIHNWMTNYSNVWCTSLKMFNVLAYSIFNSFEISLLLNKRSELFCLSIVDKIWQNSCSDSNLRLWNILNIPSLQNREGFLVDFSRSDVHSLCNIKFFALQKTYFLIKILVDFHFKSL